MWLLVIPKDWLLKETLQWEPELSSAHNMKK